MTRARGGGWTYYVRRAFEAIRDEGLAEFLKYVGWRVFALLFRRYSRWIRLYDKPDATFRKRVSAEISSLRQPPLLSILMPIAGNLDLAAKTIRSISGQLYPHWELCLGVADSVPDGLREWLRTAARDEGRIRITRAGESWAEQANAAFAIASGAFVTPVDAGDMLSEQALYWAAREVIEHPEADLLFSDEDTIDARGRRANPWFKPDWNPALMTSCNAFGRLGFFRRGLLETVGAFMPAFAGAAEHELVLRCARATTPDRIRHISRMLYHRRASSAGRIWQGGEPGQRAVEEHLAAQGIAADVTPGMHAGYRVKYRRTAAPLRVSILVATTARPDIAEPCLTSVLEKTRYEDYELLVLVNESARQAPERAALLTRFSRDPRVRIIEYTDRPFNYSEVNNLGAAGATGSALCFLNDDTEVITADWLDVLAARVSLPRVAAAGAALYYPEGTIQHAGVILGLQGIAGHACHREPRGSFGHFGRAAFEQDVSCVTAACMMIRAEVFGEVGGFDEAMPLAYNDVDLCLRLRSRGWRIIWTPAAELVHHESTSLGRHDRGKRAAQYARDVALMHERWDGVLPCDPFYNRNLALDREYALAFPPRTCGQQPL